MHYIAYEISVASFLVSKNFLAFACCHMMIYIYHLPMIGRKILSSSRVIFLSNCFKSKVWEEVRN